VDVTRTWRSTKVRIRVLSATLQMGNSHIQVQFQSNLIKDDVCYQTGICYKFRQHNIKMISRLVGDTQNCKEIMIGDYEFATGMFHQFVYFNGYIFEVDNASKNKKMSIVSRKVDNILEYDTIAGHAINFTLCLYNSERELTLDDMQNFTKEYMMCFSVYDVFVNNCQHFVNNFTRFISNDAYSSETQTFGTTIVLQSVKSVKPK
jgi:hypothetical protein